MNAAESFLEALGVHTPEAAGRLHQPVTLTIGPSAAQTFEGQVVFLTSARLLSRLYSRVLLVTPDVTLMLSVPGDSLADAAIRWADRVPISQDQIEGPVLAIGDTPHLPGATYVSASGWRVRLSVLTPVPLGSQGDGNPVGAVAAAALATAEVFKKTTLAVTSIPHQAAEEIDFSTFDYRADGQGANPPLPDCVNLGEVVQFGVGSVGSAALYTLQFLSRLQGSLELCDDDQHLTARNLGRYVHATQADVHAFRDRHKVQWASETLQRMLPDLTVTAHPVDARTYTAQRPLTRPIPLAVSAVDSVPSRRDIVDALPRRVVNAATGRTRINITRHGFNDGLACLMCDYVERGVMQREPVELYANLTGLQQGRIFVLLQERQRLTSVDLAAMVQAGRLPADRAPIFEGQLFEDLIKDGALYAAATLKSEGLDRVVTLAFVSALTGALLAGEILKETIPTLSENWHGNHYEQDLMYLPNEMRHHRVQQEGICLCRHYARQRYYGRLHGSLDHAR